MVLVDIHKLRRLVEKYKNQLANAQTEDERQSALWHLDCYETDLIILDDDYVPQKIEINNILLTENEIQNAEIPELLNNINVINEKINKLLSKNTWNPPKFRDLIRLRLLTQRKIKYLQETS